MKFTLLGTGDAIGTPKIGCDCPQCTRAKTTGAGRLRSSIPDREGRAPYPCRFHSPISGSSFYGPGSPHIDAVIWTHGHYDHFMGFGEFYRVQKIPPVYAAEPVLRYCGETFRFLTFDRIPVEPYVPFTLFGITITPFIVKHPPAFTCGFLFEA